MATVLVLSWFLPTVIIGAIGAAYVLKTLGAPLKGVPGPTPTSLLFGNASDVVKIALWPTLGTFPEPYKSWVREYGGAVFYRLGFLKLILVTDPQALHFIFVTQGNHFPRAQGIHLYFADMFAGVGLLSSEGAVHDHQRKTLNPHFSHVHVKASLGI
ncbi:hypothetical protein As57867_005272, partial [Aphanomyces stellatus]